MAIGGGAAGDRIVSDLSRRGLRGLPLGSHLQVPEDQDGNLAIGCT